MDCEVFLVDPMHEKRINIGIQRKTWQVLVIFRSFTSRTKVLPTSVELFQNKNCTRHNLWSFPRSMTLADLWFCGYLWTKKKKTSTVPTFLATFTPFTLQRKFSLLTLRLPHFGGRVTDSCPWTSFDSGPNIDDECKLRNISYQNQ